MNITKIFAVLMIVPFLAACGNTRSDRALSGAGLGAAAGAATGALVGGSPVTGALIGGAAGGVAGAATTKKQVNMGDPVWRR